jgi:drug/metabolite transporter (DMT)-like permease
MTNERRLTALEDAAIVAFVPVVWGLNFIVIKGALPAFASPAAFNAMRWVLASVVLLAITAARRESLRIAPDDRGRILALAGVGIVLQQLTFINGIRLTTAGHSALIMGLSPVMVALGAVALRMDRVPARAWAGILLSVVGLTLLVRPGAVNLPATAVGGDLLTLGSAACWAAYTLVSRPLAVRYPPAALTAVTISISTVVLVALGLPDLRVQSWQTLDWRAWGAVLYTSVLTIALGYAIWSLALRRIGTTRTAILTNINPVVAVAAAWWLLGERLTANQALGAVCVLAGVALARR